MRIQDLRAKRAEKVDAIEKLNAKMAAENYEEDEADTQVFDELEAEIKELDKKIDLAERTSKLKASLALPIDVSISRSEGSLPAQPRMRYSKLKSFKDITVRGEIFRAEDQAFRCGQFILATCFGVESAKDYCKQNGVILTRAQSENVNTAGGFLVPEEMMNSVIDLRETFGVFRREAFIAPMGRDTMNWPRRTGGVTAFFVAEGIAPTQSTANWDNVNLTAKKLAALVLMSTEVSEDAVINLADWITSEIAYAFASKEDDCGFLGDGTSTYGGIRGATVIINDGAHTAGLTTATGHSTVATLDNVDITKLMGTLPQYALGNAKFFCSQFVFANAFERLVAIAGGNSISTLDGAVQYRYLGFPISITQKMKASTATTGDVVILFGDMRKAAAMGERRQVSIKRSDERYFDTDQIGIMGTERIDINVHDMGDTTNAGPLVGLKLG